MNKNEWPVDKKTGWYYRDAIDREVMREVRRFYVDIPQIAGAVVLDLGAHAGYSCATWVAQGASQVIAVEPMAENICILKANTAGWPVVVIEAAVTADGKPVTIWPHPKGYTDRARIVGAGKRWKEGTEVPGVTLGALLAAWQPAVVKSDIEFAEYELPELLALPDCVRVLIMEVHGQNHGDTTAADEKAYALMNSFKEQGFTETRMVTKQGGRFVEDPKHPWAWNGMWER